MAKNGHLDFALFKQLCFTLRFQFKILYLSMPRSRQDPCSSNLLKRKWFMKKTLIYTSLLIGLILSACAKKDEGDKTKIRTANTAGAAPATAGTGQTQEWAKNNNILVYVTNVVNAADDQYGMQISSQVQTPQGARGTVTTAHVGNDTQTGTFQIENKNIQLEAYCQNTSEMTCGYYVLSMLVYSGNNLLYQYALFINFATNSNHAYLYNYSNNIMNMNQLRSQFGL